VGLKLNGAHYLLAYADDVNLVAISIHTVKKNAGDASREVGLETNRESCCCCCLITGIQIKVGT
jgi:hypothetical protein